MARVKRGIIKSKKRKKTLKLTKGFRRPFSNKKRLAKEAILHAFKYSYIGRKQKKRVMRRLWQVRLNAYLRNHSMKYSQFIHQLKLNNIELNRKVLSELVQRYPEVSDKILTSLK
ncbi:MAG: 50S ribosomal protein L20 [Patescibacteria group bacterium]|nr:50S ribosomal protein L20 [Patescibacteria group bacterium]